MELLLKAGFANRIPVTWETIIFCSWLAQIGCLMLPPQMMAVSPTNSEALTQQKGDMKDQ